MDINFFVWVEYKRSLIFMYVCIILVSSFQVCFLLLSHLYGNDISSLAGKGSVHWSMYLAKPLLGGREISIVAEASVFTGASLREYWGRENLAVSEASLLTGAFLVMGQDVSAHVRALLDGLRQS